MHKASYGAIFVSALTIGWASHAGAQARIVEPMPGGLGSAPIILAPQVPNLNLNLAAPSFSAPSFPAPAGVPSAAPLSPAAPAQPLTPPIPFEATATPTPQEPARQPLMSASGYTADGAQCDMSEFAGAACAGPDCLLSCTAGACPEQENASCEFVIDCAAEIAADIGTGDQQCDEATIELTTMQTDQGLVNVSKIRIPAGSSCKPPPCMAGR